MLRVFFLLSLALYMQSATAQNSLPTDYLTPAFHANRREALRKIMPPNSVVVIFAYPERVFSNDVNYIYHPNPDLYYFSGYKEPDAVLLIFKEPQQNDIGTYNELFYVRKRNPFQEQWSGRRLGIEGVRKQLGFDQVYNSEDFKNCPVDFSLFSKVIYDVLPDDVSAGTLSSLIQTFREKASIKAVDNRNILDAYKRLAFSTNASNLQSRIGRINNAMKETADPEFRNDSLLLDLIQRPDSAMLSGVVHCILGNPMPPLQFYQLTSLLREIKQPEEIAMLRKSAFISAVAHAEVMKAIHPDMSESELDGIFRYVHKKYGAEEEGYPPIVGTGANGCILHYIDNNVTQVDNQLVLMDVASEYHGYTADVTRTTPANGKFTTEQKAIYQLVLDAQNEVMAKLGITKKREDVSLYYIHGCSHHIGLDVHDKSVTTTLKENMVITVEPGIYIPEGSPCDKKWWNLAVRIEDDILIGKNQGENISSYAPREIHEVEKLAASKSVLNKFTLPPVKE
ncbi:MAG: aminopeptidase P N-terminal domain-containing protein [Saprospiraceae bacterium]|nr:aminopeptidase P N-terminal domain-containing protein [Candidatus Opimibacter iunctus]